MAAFILFAGFLNFALGYFLAMAFANPPFLGLLGSDLWRMLAQKLAFLLKRVPAANDEVDPTAETHDPWSAAVNAVPTVALVHELPESWQQTLRDDGLQLRTLATGVVHYLRLEGSVYREHLLTAESRARQALAVQDPLAMEQLAADLRFIIVDWSRKQHQAAELLEERAGRLGPAEEPALELALSLRDLEGQIVQIDREFHVLNFRADGSVACRQLQGEIQQLVRLAHVLRDATQVSLAAVYRLEGIFSQLDRKLHYDANTGLLGRLGIESLFDETFPAGSQPAAALRISTDRMGKINQRLGTRAGDQILKAVAHFAGELLAAKFEHSLLAREAGCDFLVLTNTANLEELTSLGEHIRQSFEAASFSYEGTDLTLSMTISVTALAADASLSELLNQLDALKTVATKAGRNRSARWENGAAILTLPPAIPVPARLIVVDCAAA
ncbi:MAG: GGDEF domain-containing protein [Pirellulaceae bacterium]